MILKISIILSCIFLTSSCASEKPDARDICSHNLNTEEREKIGPPTLDFGNGNIGIYTAQEEMKPAKFSLLNCKSAEFTQIQSNSGIVDIKNIVTQASANGEMSTVGSFSRNMKTRKGLTVLESKAKRSETSRAGCGCIVFYPDDWYAGFPEGFVRPIIEYDVIEIK